MVNVEVGKIFISREGIDEDAEPICYQHRKSHVVLGVFDGLGGAGGILYDGGHGRRTQAWYASRKAREIVNYHKNNFYKLSAKSLADDLHRGFDYSFKDTPHNQSKLKGSLLSKSDQGFPTTIAIACVDLKDKIVSWFWAGDSRCYWLNSSGLQCLTRDHSNVNDLLDTHFEDPPLSNYVSKKDFYIDEGKTSTQVFENYMVFACSDGLYDTWNPLEFMCILYEGIVSSETFDNFISFLSDQNKSLMKDDISASFLFVGAWYEFQKEVEPLREDIKTELARINGERQSHEGRLARLSKEIHEVELQLDILKKLQIKQSELANIKTELARLRSYDDKGNEVIKSIQGIKFQDCMNPIKDFLSLFSQTDNSDGNYPHQSDTATKIQKMGNSTRTAKSSIESILSLLGSPSFKENILKENIEKMSDEHSAKEEEIEDLQNNDSFIPHVTLEELNRKLLKEKDNHRQEMEACRDAYKSSLKNLWDKHKDSYSFDN